MYVIYKISVPTIASGGYINNRLTGSGIVKIKLQEDGSPAFAGIKEFKVPADKKLPVYWISGGYPLPIYFQDDDDEEIYHQFFFEYTPKGNDYYGEIGSFAGIMDNQFAVTFTNSYTVIENEEIQPVTDNSIVFFDPDTLAVKTSINNTTVSSRPQTSTPQNCFGPDIKEIFDYYWDIFIYNDYLNQYDPIDWEGEDVPFYIGNLK